MLSTLGSLGDLHPIVGLAQGLRARGHEVRIATSGFYRDRIEAQGIEFSVLRPLVSPDDPELLRRVLHPWKGPSYLIRTVLLPHLRDMYEDLATAARDADFLISGEVVMAAPLVAEKRQMPWAAAILAPFSFFSMHDPPVLSLVPFARTLHAAPPAVQRVLYQLFKAGTRSWGAPIARLRSELGLRATDHPLLLDRFSPLLNLALFADVLGRPQPDWPGHTVQCGFVFHDQASGAGPARLGEFLDKGKPPITFTLGSTAVMDPGDFFEQSIRAAAAVGHRALLLMGSNPLPMTDAEVFAADYAPYSEVFPRSACVVHQGGVGTTAEAFRAGVPQLVMPFAFDQPDNAERVVRSGAGLRVSRRDYRSPSAETLLERILSSSTYSERASGIARHLAAQDAVHTACDAIEHVMP